MNMEFIRVSQFFSTITNTTANIDYIEEEDLGFLTNSVHQNQSLYQNRNQFVINPIPENQEITFNCFFQQILAKCSTETNASLEQNNFWVEEDDILEVSEQIKIPQQLDSQKVPSKKIKKIKKRKTIFNSKTNKKSKRRQSKEVLNKRLELQRKIRNQTKNIPKNYGKAIISFILKNQSKVRSIVGYDPVNFQELKKELKEMKNGIKTIADLRNIWMNCKHAYLIRTLGNLFLRKYSLAYISNSKIEDTDAHIKYRSKLLRAIRNPESFQYMKGL